MKTKTRKLHKFNETRAMSLNSGENVGGLVTCMTDVVDGPRNVPAETLDVFSDNTNKPPRCCVNVVETINYVKAI